MRISEAGVGQEFIVKSVLVGREVGRRLADMGFTEGARGRVVRRSSFRGPLQIRIRDYDVLIRRCEAANIEVNPIGEMSTDLGSREGGWFGGRRRGRGQGKGGGRRSGAWTAADFLDARKGATR